MVFGSIQLFETHRVVDRSKDILGIFTDAGADPWLLVSAVSF